jgi:DNA-binding GntR family transcriptional regulator
MDMLKMGGGSLDDVDKADDETAELDSAKDILAAVKAGDPKALSLALSRHYEACSASKDEGSADEEY